MTQSDFDDAVTNDIRAIVQHCIDCDYGPYTGHPMDPRTPVDDRDLDELTYSERVELIASMPRNELEEVALHFSVDAETWKRRYLMLAAKYGETV